MLRNYILCLLILAVSSFTLSAEAQRNSRSSSQRVMKKRDTGQNALIIVDGSAIYKDPNFDSPVIEYMDRGKRIVVSQKLYRGAGGLGAFYKIRLRPRVYGYITDVDIELQGRIASKSATAATKTEPTQEPVIDGDPTRFSQDMLNESVEEAPAGEGIYYQRYVGGTYQSLNYTEKLNNQKMSASTGLLGFKMSGPGKLMGGMPLDVEVLLGVSAPSFYDKIASSTSGYMIIGHMMPMFPFAESNKYVFYYSFGPMMRYSAFKVKLKSQPTAPDVDSQELAIGLNFGAGFAYKLGQKYALRLDTRYTLEEQSYIGFGAAVQYQY